VSHDQHLIVRFRDGDAARRPYVPTAYDAGCSRDTGLCKDSILAGNVGYFKIRTFTGPVADVAGELALTMGRLARCDAVIIDTRRHPGGSPDVVRLVASYFFDSTPVLLTSVYWRAANRTEHFYTLPTVAGPRFGPTTPLYILISKRTVSAAEEFAYDLQSRKRAVVVGANSAGAAHPGGVEVIGDHFTVFVPRGRPINPITKTDWEGVGVRPDISVSADSAIVVALNEARGKRRR
jgi:C-terminal processing protease CtpA/Prc